MKKTEITLQIEKKVLDDLQRELKKYDITVEELATALLEQAASSLSLLEDFRVKRKKRYKKGTNLWLIRSAFSAGCNLYYLIGRELKHAGFKEGLIMNEMLLFCEDKNSLQIEFVPIAGYYKHLYGVWLIIDDFKIVFVTDILLGFKDDFKYKSKFKAFKEMVEDKLKDELMVSGILDNLEDYYIHSDGFDEDEIGLTVIGEEIDKNFVPHIREILKVVDKVCKKIELDKYFKKCTENIPT